MKRHFIEFINKGKSHSARGLRILVEYFYALEKFEPLHTSHTHVVSVFGSARVHEDSFEYEEARKLGQLLYEKGFAVVTGASQGVMEAANRGVMEGILAKLKTQKKYKNKSAETIRQTKEFKKELEWHSLGLKISLPFESKNNPYLGQVATFHYFMIRKFFFATLSSAFIACEGGWGTRDELYEVLTLVQTGRAPLMPIIYISPNANHLEHDLAYTLKHGYISKDDMELLTVVNSHKQAVVAIQKFYNVVQRISYEKRSCIEIFLQKELAHAQKEKLTHMVESQYKDLFPGGIHFTHQKIELRNYAHRSYGVLKKIIEAI